MPGPDFFDDIVDQASAERRIKAIEEARLRNERETAAEKERDRIATARAFEINRHQVRREYETAGVEPPSMREDGTPLVSLSWLLRMGWRIEQVGDRNVLTKPGWWPVQAVPRDWVRDGSS